MYHLQKYITSEKVLSCLVEWKISKEKHKAAISQVRIVNTNYYCINFYFNNKSLLFYQNFHSKDTDLFKNKIKDFAFPGDGINTYFEGKVETILFNL